jgi:serine/threonine protein phosphatase PrpC
VMSRQAVPYKQKISISALTDTGKVRTQNEDNFIVCTDLDNNSWVLSEGWIELSKKGCLLVLADGMGGANAGEVASSLAVDAIKESFSALTLQLIEVEATRKEFLLAAILKAHERIVAKAKSDPTFDGMGTTIVIAWAIQSKLYVCWCGDSRAYKYNTSKGLRLMTKDHSVVWALVEAGKLTPDEADVHPDNNIITQSLGDPANLPKPDIVVEDLEAGDKILLCSDGLNNMVDAKTIENELRSESPLP